MLDDGITKLINPSSHYKLHNLQNVHHLLRKIMDYTISNVRWNLWETNFNKSGKHGWKQQACGLYITFPMTPVWRRPLSPIWNSAGEILSTFPNRTDFIPVVRYHHPVLPNLQHAPNGEEKKCVIPQKCHSVAGSSSTHQLNVSYRQSTETNQHEQFFLFLKSTFLTFCKLGAITITPTYKISLFTIEAMPQPMPPRS